MSNEEWKPIPGHNGVYEVSNFGNVRSYKNLGGQGIESAPRPLKKATLSSGYMVVCLSKNNVSKNLRVHRLVMLAFEGESALDVNHIDGDKTNNRLDNLEYVTHQENIDHAVRNGLNARGEDIASSIYTYEEIYSLKIRVSNGELPFHVAVDMGMHRDYGMLVMNGKVWSHVEVSREVQDRINENSKYWGLTLGKTVTPVKTAITLLREGTIPQYKIAEATGISKSRICVLKKRIDQGEL